MNNGRLIVKDENNNEVAVQVLFSFEVPEYNLNYIAYTFGVSTGEDDMEVLISEYDQNTNEIKGIPEDQRDTVLDFYNQAKEMILNQKEQ